MRSRLVPLAVLGITSLLAAQNCPERNLGTLLGSGDDTVFTMQPIGFTFPFAGATYTDVHICANGYLTLSNAGLPAPPAGDFSATTAELISGSPRICPMWNDLNLTVNNNAGVYIDSNAARCVITWDNAVNYGMTTRFQLQVQLFASGEIQMYWSEGATNNSTFNFAAGQGISGVCPGGNVTLPAPSDLSINGTTADNTLFEGWTIQGTGDLALRGLQLIPTNPGWVYLSSPWTGCANTEDFGQGCIGARDSFYEKMSASAFDLSGTAWTMLRGSNGYTVVAAAPAYVAPTAAAAIIANADDIVQVVTLAQAMPVPGGTTSQLAVSSNGNIALAGIGNGAGFAPDTGLLLAWLQTGVAAAWHDYNPALAGSGKIVFEQVGNIAYVTWNDVYTYLTTSPDRFQYQFDLTTGNITIVYDAMTPAGNDYVVGYSRGGTSTRTDASDLSVALAGAIVVEDAEVAGLGLTTNSEPLLGNASFAFTVDNVPNVVPLAFLFVGDQSAPGLDLGFLGMPGCRAYTNANLTSATLPVAGGTGTQPLALPNTPSLAGSTLVVQAVAFSLQTPLNLVTSNGTRVVLGL